jgi:hypothetical protein
VLCLTTAVKRALVNVGPTGTSLTVQPSPTFVVGTGSGNPIVVTYNVAPPNGQWGAADSGVWSIEMVDDQVADYMQTPLYVDAGVKGSFTVTSMFVVCVRAFFVKRVNQMFWFLHFQTFFANFSETVGGCCNNDVCTEPGDASFCTGDDDRYLGDGLDCSAGCRKRFYYTVLCAGFGNAFA